MTLYISKIFVSWFTVYVSPSRLIWNESRLEELSRTMPVESITTRRTLMEPESLDDLGANLPPAGSLIDGLTSWSSKASSSTSTVAPPGFSETSVFSLNTVRHRASCGRQSKAGADSVEPERSEKALHREFSSWNIVASHANCRGKKSLKKSDAKEFTSITYRMSCGPYTTKLTRKRRSFSIRVPWEEVAQLFDPESRQECLIRCIGQYADHSRGSNVFPYKGERAGGRERLIRYMASLSISGLNEQGSRPGD